LIPVIMAATSPTGRDRLTLHVLQLGAIAVVLAALPYKAFDLDRYFVPKELVLHSCAAIAALVCIRNRNRITVTAVDVILAAFLVSSAVSMLFAINLWAAERAFAISLSGAALFWVAASLRRVGLVRPLLVVLAIGVVIGAATSLAQAYGVQTEYFSLNRSPGGTFGNRNFVAHLAAIGTPVVILVALTARPGFGSLFGGISMAIVAAALVLSRSRAAWLAVIALAVPGVILGMRTWSRWCEPRTVRRLIVLGVFTAAGVAAAVLVPNRLDWKSSSPYLDSAVGLVNYKAGSGKGRLVQYTNSLHMTEAHPAFGVGPGNWSVAYPKYASRGDPSMSQEDGVTSNPWPSSDWMAYLSERGVVGFALLVMVMIGLLGRAFGELGVHSGRDAERVLTAITLIATFVAVAVVAAFDAVLLVAVPTFFVWTLAGALAPPGNGGIEVERGIHRFAPILVLVLGVIAVGRSALQLSAIATFSTTNKTSVFERAALFDPGSYRIHTRLAQAYRARGDCKRAVVHARAARGLFPNAAEPRRELTACGVR
jgi:O-antigen ligase